MTFNLSLLAVTSSLCIRGSFRTPLLFSSCFSSLPCIQIAHRRGPSLVNFLLRPRHPSCRSLVWFLSASHHDPFSRSHFSVYQDFRLRSAFTFGLTREKDEGHDETKGKKGMVGDHLSLVASAHAPSLSLSGGCRSSRPSHRTSRNSVPRRVTDGRRGGRGRFKCEKP